MLEKSSLLTLTTSKAMAAQPLQQQLAEMRSKFETALDGSAADSAAGGARGHVHMASGCDVGSLPSEVPHLESDAVDV